MMNKVYLIGNLTRDPDTGETANGIKYARIGIAVSRRYADSDGNIQTDFFNIIAWRGLAENCEKFLSKGKKIAIIGSVLNRTYEDKEGVKRTVTDIIADEIEFLTPIDKPEQKTKKEHEEVGELPF